MCFFSFSQTFGFLGCWGGWGEGKRAKKDQKQEKVPHVALHLSGTIHHMIVIFGTGV